MSQLTLIQSFAYFCGNDPAIWKGLVGKRVEHLEYGVGTIDAVKPRPGLPVLIYITFKKTNYVTFNSESFKSGNIVDLEIPEPTNSRFKAWLPRWELERQEKERTSRAVEDAREELSLLARKYNISLHKLCLSSGPTSLVPIVLKLENKEIISETELELLQEMSLHNVVATYFYQRYKIDHDLWNLAKTCRYLRMAHLPQKVIDITKDLNDGLSVEKKALGAVWTSRGGALRDLKEYDQAVVCGKQAIAIFPSSPYPYMLLGAVCFEQHDYEPGMNYFDQAERLGGRQGARESEIRSVIAKGNARTRREIAEFLLKRDPERFKWAKNFL